MLSDSRNWEKFSQMSLYPESEVVFKMYSKCLCGKYENKFQGLLLKQYGATQGQY